MKLRDLPLGSRILFGTNLGDEYSARQNYQMSWTKVSMDGLFLCGTPLDAAIDIPRSNGATIKERTAGRCYFPDTMLYQFLNSKEEWATDETIRKILPWQYSRAKNGFLSWFSESERNVMKQWNMQIIPPKRLQKRLGEVVTVPTMVGLPAIAEYSVYNDDAPAYLESEKHEVQIQRRSPQSNHQTIHTRSSIGESVYSIGSTSRSPTPKPPNTQGLAYPVICMDLDVDIERGQVPYGAARGPVWVVILPESERSQLIEEINNLYGW